MSGHKLSDKQRGWLEHIEACVASGGSMKAYAEEHGFDLQSFYLWKGRLKKLGVVEAACRSVSVGPVRVGSPVHGKASIQFANGVSIEVPPGFDAASMTELLKVAMRL